MTDQATRADQRGWLTGDQRALARLLAARVRTGELSSDQVRCGAEAGLEGAVIVLGAHVPAYNQGLSTWFDRWRNVLGRRVVARICAALVRVVLDAPGLRPDFQTELPGRAARLVEGWTRSETSWVEATPEIEASSRQAPFRIEDAVGPRSATRLDSAAWLIAVTLISLADPRGTVVLFGELALVPWARAVISASEAQGVVTREVVEWLTG